MLEEKKRHDYRGAFLFFSDAQSRSRIAVDNIPAWQCIMLFFRNDSIAKASEKPANT